MLSFLFSTSQIVGRTTFTVQKFKSSFILQRDSNRCFIDANLTNTVPCQLLVISVLYLRSHVENIKDDDFQNFSSTKNVHTCKNYKGTTPGGFMFQD